MRTLPALVFAGACLMLPSTASAQSTPLCVIGGGPEAYQARLGPYLGSSPSSSMGGAAGLAARAALGAQYGGLWADTPRQGWSVAFAPGPLDAAGARAAIVADLATRVDAETLAYLDELLAVYPTPYSEAELLAVQAQITSLLGPLVNSTGIGCHETDGFRVRVGVTGDTPDVVAHVQGLLAPFGDKVYVRYGQPAIVPAIDQAKPEDVAPRTAPKPRVGAYATLPKAGRCVRGRTIGVRARASKELRSVALVAGKRHVTAKAGKRARLRLTSRATKVQVTVTLTDGRTATKTVTFRRCG